MVDCVACLRWAASSFVSAFASLTSALLASFSYKHRDFPDDSKCLIILGDSIFQSGILIFKVLFYFGGLFLLGHFFK